MFVGASILLEYTVNSDELDIDGIIWSISDEEHRLLSYPVITPWPEEGKRMFAPDTDPDPDPGPDADDDPSADTDVCSEIEDARSIVV